MTNDTAWLDKGQAARVLGTVEDPTEGCERFGGEADVKAAFTEGGVNVRLFKLTLSCQSDGTGLGPF